MTGWRGFAFDALPALPAETARWTTVLARARARMRWPLTIAVKGVGEIEIRPDHVAFAAAGAETDAESMEWFSLGCDGRRAWVGVDRRLSLALVRGVLGGPPAPAVRSLSPAERGLMAAILLSALDALGVSARVELGFAAGPPDPAQDRLTQDWLTIVGSVRTAAGMGGRAVLLVPVAWLAGAADGPLTGRLESVAVRAILELGRTDLARAVIASAAMGDAVVFEAVPSLGRDGPWPARLRVGNFVAPAAVAPDGALALAGPFSRVEEESMVSQDERPRWIPVEPSSSEVASLIAGAPVEVVAEIGRLTLRGDELAGLMKGGVLSLGPRPTDAIQLRVGGQLWATGELVNLGDELGVRILKLHAG